MESKALQIKVEDLEKRLAAIEKFGVVKKAKKPPSEYNKFIATAIIEIKAEHPEITKHSEVFKLAVKKWRESRIVVETKDSKETTVV